MNYINEIHERYAEYLSTRYNINYPPSSVFDMSSDWWSNFKTHCLNTYSLDFDISDQALEFEKKKKQEDAQERKARREENKSSGASRSQRRYLITQETGTSDFTDTNLDPCIDHLSDKEVEELFGDNETVDLSEYRKIREAKEREQDIEDFIERHNLINGYGAWDELSKEEQDELLDKYL